MKRYKKRIRRIISVVAAVILFFYWLQTYGVHMDDKESECVSVFGWITKSDRVPEEESAPFENLQPGDILLTLSTHTLGWRHGHAGLVIDEDSVLECRILGKDSAIVNIREWRRYSNYVVLRVKNITEEKQQAVVSFARENLCGVPYRLSAGLWTRDADGLQCAYLVWCAWQHLGYNLDSDGGRLVTVRDILLSEETEVIQTYGFDLK